MPIVAAFSLTAVAIASFSGTVTRRSDRHVVPSPPRAAPFMDFEHSLINTQGMSSAAFAPARPLARRARAPSRTASASVARSSRASKVNMRSVAIADFTAEAPALSPRRIYSRTELTHQMTNDGQRTMLLFGAKACRTCRMLQPKMERIAASAGVRFLYVHFDSYTAPIFVENSVAATPTVFVYDAYGALADRAVYSSASLPQLSLALERAAAGVDRVASDRFAAG